MKYLLYISLPLFLFFSISKAQDEIKVSMVKGKYNLSLNKDLYTLPITFSFDESTFKGKSIAFYSDNKKKDKIVDAKFGSSDLGLFGNTLFYKIKLNEDGTIGLKKGPSTKSNVLYFTINGGSVSQPINFKTNDGDVNQPTSMSDKKREPESDLVTIYKSGSIIFDAIKLVDLKNRIESGKSDPPERKLLPSILSNYGINSSPDLTKNQYLLKELGRAYDIGAQSGVTPEKILSSVALSLGNLDVTNIADGFAKFIVARTKQELSIAFFNKFKATLNEPKYVDLQTVFPQTYKALSAIGDEIYMYNAFVQTLRESFEKDLATLPTNLPSIIDNHKDLKPELKAILQTGFYLTKQIQANQHPGNIIENYPVEYLAPLKNSNIIASFETFQLLSTSLKNNVDPSRYWAPSSDIKLLLSNDTSLLEIYLGLLEQQAKMNGIVFNGKTGNSLELWKTIDSSFPTIDSDFPKYKTFFSGMFLRIQNLETQISLLKTKVSDSLSFEYYYTFASSFVDLLKYLTQFESLPFMPAGLNLQKETGIYFSIAQTSCDLAIDVNRKNYSSAIVDTKRLYDFIFTDNTTSSALFKYGSLMAAVATAKNSDDVESAIEAVVLPVGSSNIKRETMWNIALNAYCGIFTGGEKISGVNNMTWNSYGIAAPIGISFSKGKSSWVPILGAFYTDGHFSQSLFVSIVDFGALTAFRFTDDSTQAVPNVQLKDIVSPGIFYSYGIPYWPLSINLGWQMGPLLRAVTKTANTAYSQSYSRFSISLSVDIPLLDFYTKPND